MHRIERYTRILDAVQAADHLVANGVMARVLGDRETFGGLGAWGGGSFEVAVFDKARAEEARALLAAMEPTVDVDWDDALAPNLARLDPELAPDCPACGDRLPLDAPCDACPACSEPVDIPDLIAQTHGPEALLLCYPTEEAPIDERALPSARLHCPNCFYSLEGLAVEGACPECGRPYDKRVIVRSILD